MADSADTLQELTARVAGLTFEMAGMRAVLDVQFKRIAAMQAELDLLPTARRRRKTTMTSLPSPAHNRSGNGRTHV